MLYVVATVHKNLFAINEHMHLSLISYMQLFNAYGLEV